MTGMEVFDKIERLHNARREKAKVFMAMYDMEMNMQIGTLRGMCPHDNVRPTDNGLGWIGTECVWCGKQLTNEYLDVKP